MSVIKIKPSRQYTPPLKMAIAAIISEIISIISNDLNITDFKDTSVTLLQFVHLWEDLFFTVKASKYPTSAWQYGHIGKLSLSILNTSTKFHLKLQF